MKATRKIKVEKDDKASLKEIASKIPNEVLFKEKVSQAKEYIKRVSLSPIVKAK